MNSVILFQGRAMWLKGADYPADQRDRARLVFLVPCGRGSALENLSIDHSRHALLSHARGWHFDSMRLNHVGTMQVSRTL